VLRDIDLAPFVKKTKTPAAQFSIGRIAAAILQGNGKP
jgi:hypothetical protein